MTKHFCVTYVLLTDVSFWLITVLCDIAEMSQEVYMRMLAQPIPPPPPPPTGGKLHFVVTRRN